MTCRSVFTIEYLIQATNRMIEQQYIRIIMCCLLLDELPKAFALIIEFDDLCRFMNQSETF